MVKDRLFWAKVSKSATCWEYTGAIHSEGYGWVNRNGKCTRAHRWAWQLTHGPIQNGKWVLHKCDNRKCVRPSHLFLGTHADNMKDMASKGRQNSPRGEAHKSSKLAMREIYLIRAAYQKGVRGLGMAEIGLRFKVSGTNINSIVKGRTWA